MLKELRKLAYLSVGLAALSLTSPARAALVGVDTVPGTCTGAPLGATDCSTATGHIGVSVIGTLSVNELRAISFGNIALTAATGGSVILKPDGTYGATTGAIQLLHGADADGGTGGGEPGIAGNDGQRAGLYEIKGAGEGTAVRVYVFFNTIGKLPLDVNGSTDYTANQVDVTNGTEIFKADTFTFVDALGTATIGRDVYGDYIDGPPADAATAFNLNVGAKLTAQANAYPAGKYVGEFNITVSY